MLHYTPATSTSSVLPFPSPSPAQPKRPDFAEWSNAARFALVERLLKSIVDSLDDRARCAPVVGIAKKLIGKVHFAGYEAAIADPRVLDVDFEAGSNADKWSLTVALCEWVSESWDDAEVEQYDVDVCFEQVLHEIAGLDVEHLGASGGGR